jgi:hypothetical protein
MSVPVSDFIKIQKNYDDVETMESDLRAAIRNLVDHAHKMGTVTTLENLENTNGIELVYGDACGMKVAVAVVLNKDGSNFQLISNSVGETVVDKVVILTDSNIVPRTGAEEHVGETVVNMDRSKMIDLLYFNSMYKKDEIKGDDLERALTLAKSIKLC